MPKKLDVFTRNVIIVFAGTSLANFLNLLYQLLIAHRLLAPEFASFNSLLAIFTILTAPLLTFQLAVAKYCSESSAHNQPAKIRFFLSDLLKKTSFFAAITLIVFLFSSNYLLRALKITSISSGYILGGIFACTWFISVFSGGVQGLEFFNWFSFVSVSTGTLKLILAYFLTYLGYNISGALGALLVANIITVFMLFFPLRQFFATRPEAEKINYHNDFIPYLFPVAVAGLSFMSLVNIDMVLVKYFFSVEDSGIYSLAQMVGKIFLFLPLAISTVMFPRTSALNAKQIDTSSILKRSLIYVSALCLIAFAIYNAFPSQVLKALTGKVNQESILIGRLFGISMSFFALAYTLQFYLLSVKDMRFIKFLVLFTLSQIVGIAFFHQTLVQVQLILCINSILLVFVSLLLAFKKKHK